MTPPSISLRLREERAAVGLFDRSERRRIAAMTAAAEYNRGHYDQLAGERADTVEQAVEERCAWLDGNADRAAALLAAESDTNIDDHHELRDELARLASSEALLGRDAHARDIAARAPELPPELPAVEMDIDLDFGP